MYKTCRTCNEEKPLDAFYPDPRYKGGRKHECKRCDAARQKRARDQNPELRERRNQSSRDWRARNPEKHKEAVRRSGIRSRYGLSSEEYDALMEGAVCPICGKQATVLDHNHTTLALREPLCASCNAGIGMFYESPVLLAAASVYLDKYGNPDSGGLGQE